MDLKDLLKQISDRTKHKESIQNEEATKNAFIMPFLQSLGYDIPPHHKEAILCY